MAAEENGEARHKTNENHVSVHFSKSSRRGDKTRRPIPSFARRFFPRRVPLVGKTEERKKGKDGFNRQKKRKKKEKKMKGGGKKTKEREKERNGYRCVVLSVLWKSRISLSDCFFRRFVFPLSCGILLTGEMSFERSDSENNFNLSFFFFIVRWCLKILCRFLSRRFFFSYRFLIIVLLMHSVCYYIKGNFQR